MTGKNEETKKLEERARRYEKYANEKLDKPWYKMTDRNHQERTVSYPDAALYIIVIDNLKEAAKLYRQAEYDWKAKECERDIKYYEKLKGDVEYRVAMDWYRQHD